MNELGIAALVHEQLQWCAESEQANCLSKRVAAGTVLNTASEYGKQGLVLDGYPNLAVTRLLPVDRVIASRLHQVRLR